MLALFLAGGAPGAAVEVEQTRQHYAITGSKARQLKRDMKRLGPREGGRRYVAYTAWTLTWTYTFDEGARECRLDAFDVRAEIETTLPRWEPAAGARSELIEKWERFLEAIERHEAGHARLAFEAAGSVDAAVRSLGARSTCAELEREIVATAEQEVERYRRREREYDQETRHGRTQGARLW
jgi:predicted secreted Zn-dependent protease